MRDRELDLIAALAEGSLEDETEARALLASSEEARLEFEAQKTAIEVLSTVEPVAMSDSEKAAIHRDLWTELTKSSSPAKSTPWYYRWAPVAASLFVVVGIGAVLVQNDSGDEAFETAAADVTTTAADGGAETFGEVAGDGADDLDGPTSSPDIASEEMYADHAQKVREGTFTAFLSRGAAGGEEATDLQACVDQSPELDGYVVIGALPAPGEPLTSETQATVIAASPLGQSLSDAPIAFVDLETCEVLYFES